MKTLYLPQKPSTDILEDRQKIAEKVLSDKIDKLSDIQNKQDIESLIEDRFKEMIRKLDQSLSPYLTVEQCGVLTGLSKQRLYDIVSQYRKDNGRDLKWVVRKKSIGWMADRQQFLKWMANR